MSADVHPCGTRLYLVLDESLLTAFARGRTHIHIGHNAESKKVSQKYTILQVSRRYMNTGRGEDFFGFEAVADTTSMR